MFSGADDVQTLKGKTSSKRSKSVTIASGRSKVTEGKIVRKNSRDKMGPIGEDGKSVLGKTMLDKELVFQISLLKYVYRSVLHQGLHESTLGEVSAQFPLKKCKIKQDWGEFEQNERNRWKEMEEKSGI